MAVLRAGYFLEIPAPRQQDIQLRHAIPAGADAFQDAGDGCHGPLHLRGEIPDRDGTLFFTDGDAETNASLPSFTAGESGAATFHSPWAKMCSSGVLSASCSARMLLARYTPALEGGAPSHPTGQPGRSVPPPGRWPSGPGVRGASPRQGGSMVTPPPATRETQAQAQMRRFSACWRSEKKTSR